jgi:hypothetical protein
MAIRTTRIPGRLTKVMAAWLYLLGVPQFVRVTNRHGWEVEVVEPTGVVQSQTLASRDEALAYAQSLDPEWIEIGDIVDLDTSAQQHSWTTLRRGTNGSYAPSLLRWQSERVDRDPREPRPASSPG